MTYPRVERDLLILVASLRRSPSAPELFCLLSTDAEHQKDKIGPIIVKLKDSRLFLPYRNVYWRTIAN